MASTARICRPYQLPLGMGAAACAGASTSASKAAAPASPNNVPAAQPVREQSELKSFSDKHALTRPDTPISGGTSARNPNEAMPSGQLPLP
jgi:hypothetical protein